MSSGKQLSFANGEVSPSLRFRTDLAEYSAGLSVFSNGRVRKAGGGSNRPGFKHIVTPAFQTDVNVPGRFRIFGERFVEGKAHLLMQPSGSLETIVWREIFGGTENPNSLSGGVDLTNVKTTRIDNRVILSNGTRHWEYDYDSGLNVVTAASLLAKVALIKGVITGSSQSFKFGTGFLSQPVVYRVYQEFKDGSEVFYAEFASYSTAGVDSPIQPTERTFTQLTLDLTGDDLIKHYNVYRASRTSTVGGTTNFGPWGLVGRWRKPDVNFELNDFGDYIWTPEFTLTPPDETYLYGNFVGAKNLHFSAARLIGHYQQRRVVVINPDNSLLEEGALVVSKLGVPDQLDTHVVFNATGAFDFKIPEGIQGRIIASLEMEKWVLFTEDAVVVIQGGDNGIITPNQINPKVISREGVSMEVTPVQLGNRGYFMSKNNNRLMMIQFGLNNEVEVVDLSERSDHLIERDRVVQMEVTKGKEERVWLLKADGKLVSVVVHANGQATGWASVETDGFIESITVLTLPRENPIDDGQISESHDSLFISVIRDEVRLIEALTFREDVTNEQFTYMDSSASFGSHLYFRREFSLYNQYDRATETLSSDRFNIEGGVTWGVDEDITVKALLGTPFSDPATLARRIDFFYEDGTLDDDGNEIIKVLRFRPTGFVSTSEVTGRFEKPVPTELQDVEAAAPSDKLIRQTRWLFADNSVSGLTHLASKIVSVLADGLVVSSPNNPKLTDLTLTVSAGGALTLPDFYNFGAVGLPYDFDFETLDLDTSDQRTLTDAKKLIGSVGIAFYETRGGFVGPKNSDQNIATEMQPIRFRKNEIIEQPTRNSNEHVVEGFPGRWEQSGRVHIKQVDPLPMTILAVYPKGIAGD